MNGYNTGLCHEKYGNAIDRLCSLNAGMCVNKFLGWMNGIVIFNITYMYYSVKKYHIVF